MHLVYNFDGHGRMYNVVIMHSVTSLCKHDVKTKRITISGMCSMLSFSVLDNQTCVIMLR